MARLPSISARAPPRRKASSSGSTSTQYGAKSSSSLQPQLTKAAKRSARRQQLLKTGLESDQNGETSRPMGGSHGSSLAPQPSISRSALRRRKRKLRDHSVLGREGFENLKDELDELADDHASDDAGEGGEALHDVEGNPNATPARSLAQVQDGRTSKVGSRMRRNVLAQESIRQPHILRDLYSASKGGKDSSGSSNSNPFAAIRLHAQNAMGLKNPGSNRPEGDVDMR